MMGASFFFGFMYICPILQFFLHFQFYTRSFLLGQVFLEDFFYNTSMKIQERIKELRIEKGLSQTRIIRT